jgi:hypothetical protein
MNFVGENLEPKKCVAFLVVSDELATNVTPEGDGLLRTELSQACGLAADLTFLSIISESTDVQSAASTGLTPTAFLSDLKDALLSLQLDSTSKVYLIVPPDVCMVVAMMNASGVMSFPSMGITGGTIQGVQVIPSNALTDQMILLDARGIAVDAPVPIINDASHTTLELSDSPTAGTPGQLISLWQNNLRGLRAERYLAARLLRPSAIATITGVGVTA